jgi:Protein of unknown function (DUF3592)
VGGLEKQGLGSSAFRQEEVATAMRYYFALVGVVCLIASAWLFVRRLHVAFGGKRATGKVVGFVSGEDDGSVFYQPRVEFRDQLGNTHTFVAGSGGTRQEPPIGSELPVRYNPNAPETAYVVSFLHMWAAPIAFAVLGVGALLAYRGD